MILFVSFSIDNDTKVCYNIYRNKEHRAKPITKRSDHYDKSTDHEERMENLQNSC